MKNIMHSLLISTFFTLSSSLLADPFELLCGTSDKPNEFNLDAIAASCPSGYTDYGVDCIANCRSGYSTWDQLSCSRNCGSGYTEIGHTCSKWTTCGSGWFKYPCIDAYIRDSYMRGHKVKDFCPSGTSIWDGSCFGSCPLGYIPGAGGLCNCDDTLFQIEMIDFLLNKKSALISSGSDSLQCLTGIVSAISDIDWSAIRANPALLKENTAINTFSSCMQQLSVRRRMEEDNPEHIVSIEVGVFGSFGVSGTFSIGFALNAIAGGMEQWIYTSECEGGKTDISVGAYVALMGTKDHSSVAGQSEYLSVGVDIFVGAGATIVWNSDGAIGGGVSLSAELGLNPINIEWGTCYTNWL